MEQTAKKPLTRSLPPDHGYDHEVACPWCESTQTRLVSPYGPSAAEMMFKCDGCLQSFGWMKWQHRLPE